MQSSPPESRPPIRILFVDDEKNVLDGLRRGMYSMRTEWDMSFALGATEALECMRQQPLDVVVSDMRMPGMSGCALLNEVKRLYPQTIRFILSGYADSGSVMQVAGIAHQYLSKPCECAVLKVALARTVGLRTFLGDKSLIEQIGKVESLPSLPSIYQKIMACLQGSDPSLVEIGRIISGDVVMTTMVLKLANSAFFGAKQSFRTADRAVSFLGVDTISGLVLAHSLFNQVALSPDVDFNLEQLWHHSLQTATGLRALARHEQWSTERVDEAFLAGVLHDLGKLVLATRAAGVQPSPTAASAEASAPWDANHGAVGAYLLGLWGFSDTLVEAIAFHHTPSHAVGEDLGLAGLLHIADRLSQHADDEGVFSEAELESGYLESLGLSERLADWQELWTKSASQPSVELK